MSFNKLPGAFMGVVVGYIFLWSCNQPSVIQNTNRYFDLVAFFKSRNNILSKSDLLVEKKVYVNGSEEIVRLPASSIKWEKEFLLFSQCDLNKPALLDAYEIEVMDNGAQQIMTYRLVKGNAPVSRVKILHRNKPELTEMEIKIRQRSLMNIQETELWYSPRGYAVRKKTTPRFWGKPSLLVIEARFIAQSP